MKNTVSSLKSTILFLAIFTTGMLNVQAGDGKLNESRKANHAVKLFIKQDYAHAYSILNRLYETSENPKQYSFLLGMCAISLETDKEIALKYFLEAKELEKTSFVINYYLGRTYLHLGNFNEAVISFNSYLEEMYKLDKPVEFKTVEVNEVNQYHMEKSIAHVYGFIASCRNN